MVVLIQMVDAMSFMILMDQRSYMLLGLKLLVDINMTIIHIRIDPRATRFLVDTPRIVISMVLATASTRASDLEQLTLYLMAQD